MLPQNGATPNNGYLGNNDPQTMVTMVTTSQPLVTTVIMKVSI